MHSHSRTWVQMYRTFQRSFAHDPGCFSRGIPPFHSDRTWAERERSPALSSVRCSALLGMEGVEHGLKKLPHILPISRHGLESITFGRIRLLKESILQEVFLLYLTLVSLHSFVVGFPLHRDQPAVDSEHVAAKVKYNAP